MIFYFNANGAGVGSIPTRVFQGSDKASEIIFACPTSKDNVVDVAFTLPNGEATSCLLMDKEESAGGIYDAEGQEFSFYKIALPLSVTALEGVVRVQFFITCATGEKVATATNSFLVEKGVLAVEPEKTDSYSKVIERLASLEGIYDIINKKQRLEEIDAEVTEMKAAFPRLMALVESANCSLTFENYENFVLSVSNYSNEELKVGQSVYIKTLNVPDVWVYSVNTEFANYSFVSEEQTLKDIEESGYLTVGYYTFAGLETLKVDLEDYLTKEQIDVTDNGDGTATLVIGVGE